MKVHWIIIQVVTKKILSENSIDLQLFFYLTLIRI